MSILRAIVYLQRENNFLMALSRIWSAFIIVAIFVAAIKCFFLGDTQLFSLMVTGKAGDPSNPLKVDGIIETCWVAVDICLKLVGVLALFIGLMSIAERAGGIRLLARIIGPFFSKLFPQVPKGHPAMGHMIMNFSANLLGLDNAATPFGLRAMESLQEINPDKARASDSQIMFLCLHAAGLNIIPVSVIAVRASNKCVQSHGCVCALPDRDVRRHADRHADRFLQTKNKCTSAGHHMLGDGNFRSDRFPGAVYFHA